MIVAPSRTELVELAWADLVALHKYLERNPRLQSTPAFIAELLETHKRYVAIFAEWERKG